MSRGGLMFWCITVAGSLLLYLRASQVLVAGLAVVAVVSALLTSRASEDLDVLNEQPSLASGLIHRIGSSDSFAERGHYVIENLIQGVVNHPFGEGLGVGQPGGMYASYGIRSSLGYESEWGRIAYEIGPAGLLGVLLMRFVAGLICWRALLQTTDVHRRLVLATAIAFFGIMSLGWMAFNHVGNSAAWAVLALALAAVPRQQQQT
jgi:hypothetical protein